MKIPFNIWNRKKQKGKGEDPDAVRVLNEDNSVSITVTIGDVDYTVNNLKPKSTPSQEESAKEIISDKYSLIVFDELHRTGANEWQKQVKDLLDNQDE